MRHVVAISDIHLSEVEPGTGLWMRYRQKEYAPSVEIAEMIDELRERVRGDELLFVLNGDVFDFDAPYVEDGRSVHHDQPRDAAHAAPFVARILRDHPALTEALGRIIADGQQVLFISGNHDAQLTLPEVRDVVRDAIVAAARSADPAATTEDLRSRVLFRAWFHRTPDGVVIEHGHQYDTFCSFRYPMAPYGAEPGLIQPTLGSLVSRHYMARLGYFNPHVDATFMLTFWGHLKHWARYYFLSRRSQAWIWLYGALAALATLVVRRDPGDRARRADNARAAAAETGCTLREVARHARLHAPPGEDRLWRCARELWLDRALLTASAVALAAVWLASWQHAFGVIASLCPVAMVAFDKVRPKPTLEDNWRTVQRCARQVAKVHRARAVIFGHTHTPEGVREGGVFYGNTGSWSAAYRDVACTEPLFEERPLVWLKLDNDDLEGGLCVWKRGSFRHV
ncbi:MAG: metallophosphoesterase [Polyangiaceae bacterium]